MSNSSEGGLCQELVGVFLTSKNYLILIHDGKPWSLNLSMAFIPS